MEPKVIEVKYGEDFTLKVVQPNGLVITAESVVFEHASLTTERERIDCRDFSGMSTQLNSIELKFNLPYRTL